MNGKRIGEEGKTGREKLERKIWGQGVVGRDKKILSLGVLFNFCVSGEEVGGGEEGRKFFYIYECFNSRECFNKINGEGSWEIFMEARRERDWKKGGVVWSKGKKRTESLRRRRGREVGQVCYP